MLQDNYRSLHSLFSHTLFDSLLIMKLNFKINNIFIISERRGGKLVDPTPEIEKERKAELEKLATQFGCSPGTDMTAFPTFSFTGMSCNMTDLLLKFENIIYSNGQCTI